MGIRGYYNIGQRSRGLVVVERGTSGDGNESTIMSVLRCYRALEYFFTTRNKFETIFLLLTSGRDSGIFLREIFSSLTRIGSRERTARRTWYG